MNVFTNSALAGASGQGGGYQIERSLRFNLADTPSLTRAITGTVTTYTVSMWVKRAHIGGYQFLWDSGAKLFGFMSGTEALTAYNGSHNQTTSVYRDPSAWMHLVFSVNSGTLTIYVNNESVKTGDTGFSVAGTAYIGAYSVGGYNFNGYMANVHFIDGQALAPSDFGKFNSNNVWQPIEYAGTYGTNGAYLDFSDTSSNAALGTDTSGNSNTWTVNNLSVIQGNGTYLSDGTISGAGELATYEWAKAFNGILSGNGAQPDTASQPTTFTFGSAISATAGTVIIYSDSGTANDGSKFLVNGTYADSTNCTLLNSSAPFKYRMDSVTSLTSVANRHYMNLLGVEVNGTLLVDNSFTNTDALRDSPTNGTQTDTGVGGEVVGNYATWNPLTASLNLTNGNLVGTGVGGYTSATSSIAVKQGKWYAEFQ